jgi:polysaccharide export outer membrane protein
MQIFLILFSAFTLFSCSRPACRYQLHNAEEFVAQSMMINQGGKFTIKEMEGEATQELSDDVLIHYDDRIAEGDVLTIAIFHPTRRDLMDSIQLVNDRMRGFAVTNGMIYVPCIAPVMVVGLTLEEARHVLKERFCEEIDGIEVFLKYRERPKHKVELTGLVETAEIPVDGRVRLYEVLALAQLPPEANLFASYVMRDGCLLKVDIHRLIKEGDMSQNIVMKGGDKIFIAGLQDSTVLVMGEVLHPRPIPLPAGFIPLREALVLAHGIPFTGNKNNIQIIRGGVVCPQIFVVSWDFMLHQPNENLLLIPGDIVYVSQKPITQWNIFLQQLQVTANAALTGYALYRIGR